jgi:hypothetical protein
MEAAEDRFIRGVLDEAAIVADDRGPFKRITIRESRAVDEETGTIIKTLRSMYFREVYIGGEPASEVELLAMRGNRIEVHFLTDDTAEVRLRD